MIVTKTPLRIPFFSGGSDIKDFYQRETGAALSCTIDKYVYVCINKNEDDTIRFLYDPTEVLSDLFLMKHQITKEVLNYFINENSLPLKGLTISSIGDINHKGTGLGSSSAYTVGLIHAIFKLIGEYPCSTEVLAQLACYIEIEKCSFPIGKQDQYAAAYGGFNLFEFNPRGITITNHISTPILRDFNKLRTLEENLFLVNTKIVRDSTNILKNYKSISMDEEKFNYAKYNKNMAYEGLEFIRNQDFDSFGDLFNKSWEFKKAMNKSYSNSEIDYYYTRCRGVGGAYGGKVLGAGGGGFMLFYVPKQNHNDFKNTIEQEFKLEITPFKFTNKGSEIILCE